MKVRLVFTVSDNALPALITVRSFSGRLMLFRNVRAGRNELCFNTCARNLIVTVRPYDVRYSAKAYFIKAGSCRCLCVRLVFNYAALWAEALQSFTLYDANYFFPVESAVLSFSGGG